MSISNFGIWVGEPLSPSSAIFGTKFDIYWHQGIAYAKFWNLEINLLLVDVSTFLFKSYNIAIFTLLKS